MGAQVIFEYIKHYSCCNIEKIVIIDMTPKLMKSADWNCGLPGIFSKKQGDFGHEDNLYLLSVMLDNWEAYSRVVAQRILNKSLYNEKMEFNAAADFKGKEDLPWLYEEAKKNKAWVVAAFWIAMAAQDYRPVLPTISAPCLLTYGMESNYYPPENYEYMQKQIPAARVVAFPGCGHALHIQDAELFNKTVLNFLQSCPANKVGPVELLGKKPCWFQKKKFLFTFFCFSQIGIVFVTLANITFEAKRLIIFQ
jgi:non-heme chloroperoxidase